MPRATAPKGQRPRPERPQDQGFLAPLGMTCNNAPSTRPAPISYIPPSMTFKLVSFAGDQDFELAADHPYVVGRAVTSDIPIFDPTISRRHAELRAGKDGVQVRDLGSSNGTFINGTRVTEGMIEPNDSVTFGKVVFQLKSLETASRPITASHPNAGGTIVKQVSVSGGVPAVIVGQAAEMAAKDGGGQLKVAAASHTERQARKLSLLLEVSQKLSGELD